ncbi:MAG: pirin family protein [Christensenellales bacterium]
MKRKVEQVVTGTATQDGAGVKLVRVLGHDTTTAFDPFLMLDAFDSRDPRDYVKGFPWHPHRGIETVTYLIRGDIEHMDSLGNKGSILDGCCQWMTAGSGILHQEMPQTAPRMLGLQLWLNLPAKDKMCAPAYHDIRDESVPVVAEEGASVRVIAGEYKGIEGAAQGDYVRMRMLDVDLRPGAAFHLETEQDETLFVYLVAGSGSFGETGEVIGEKQALLFSKGDELALSAGTNGLRFILCQAGALKEPIAWGGPIVMNTRAQLQQAFDELDKGTFIKAR